MEAPPTGAQPPSAGGRLRRAFRRFAPPVVRAAARAIRARWRRLVAPWLPRPTAQAFPLGLPEPPASSPRARRSGPGGLLRSRPLSTVWVDVPRTLYVGGILRRQGLAGYEPAPVSCFLAALAALECRLAFDVGANIGLYTLLGAGLTPTRIVAFEPEPSVAAALAWTIRLNGLSARAEAVAVGDREGVAPLYISDTTDASNSLNADFRRATGTVEVPVITLDGYCSMTGRWPELIKVDTETTEPDVLRGAPRLLARRPWILCEVLPGGAGAQIEGILGPLGYGWYQIADPLPPIERDRIVGHETLEASNWLFLPSRPPDGLWTAAVEWRQRIGASPPAA
jgi:FkbM family methyltransferase